MVGEFTTDPPACAKKQFWCLWVTFLSNGKCEIWCSSFLQFIHCCMVSFTGSRSGHKVSWDSYEQAVRQVLWFKIWLIILHSATNLIWADSDSGNSQRQQWLTVTPTPCDKQTQKTIPSHTGMCERVWGWHDTRLFDTSKHADTHIATPKNSCLAVDTTTSACCSTLQYSSLGTWPLCNTLHPSLGSVCSKEAGRCMEPWIQSAKDLTHDTYRIDFRVEKPVWAERVQQWCTVSLSVHLYYTVSSCS